MGATAALATLAIGRVTPAQTIRAPDAVDPLPPGEERGRAGQVIAGLALGALVLTLIAWATWWVVHG